MSQENAHTLPPVIFGTSGLGNIYEALPYERKLAIVNECIKHSPGTPVFDSAGKYGAGLSLEVLGKCLKDLGVSPNNVIINNKLGWYQTELTTEEPTFEKGIWKELKNDAIQKISYQGILECFEQGNELLGEYNSDMVSVHDPDEYLASSINEGDHKKRYNDIIEAYKALSDLKKQGKAKSIGIGSKDWKAIERIVQDIELDWVMIANSLTIHSHPKELIAFIEKLNKKGITVINSAVFNGGFLIGSNFYNYVEVDPATNKGKELLNWRTEFYEVCKAFDIKPAEACFNFGFNIPGIKSIALSTTRPEKVKENIAMVTKQIPDGFWQEMRKRGLIQI
ncbi:aldo/keto reductase [Pseudopedobacter beijingensis]|uniref:Aldo/keto reductase n=1 Tax=Pseudopedobacter beijingensis TaxID=1207056 RepID=A0ABW4I867_9SPHI